MQFIDRVVYDSITYIWAPFFVCVNVLPCISADVFLINQ